MAVLVRVRRNLASVDENDKQLWHLEVNVALNSPHRDKLRPLLQRRSHNSGKHALNMLEAERHEKLVRSYKRASRGGEEASGRETKPIQNNLDDMKTATASKTYTQLPDHPEDEGDWNRRAHNKFRDDRRRALIEDLHHRFMNPKILGAAVEAWLRYTFGTLGGASGRHTEEMRRKLAATDDPNLFATGRMSTDRAKCDVKEKFQRV